MEELRGGKGWWSEGWGRSGASHHLHFSCRAKHRVCSSERQQKRPVLWNNKRRRESKINEKRRNRSELYSRPPDLLPALPPSCCLLAPCALFPYADTPSHSICVRVMPCFKILFFFILRLDLTATDSGNTKKKQNVQDGKARDRRWELEENILVATDAKKCADAMHHTWVLLTLTHVCVIAEPSIDTMPPYPYEVLLKWPPPVKPIQKCKTLQLLPCLMRQQNGAAPCKGGIFLIHLLSVIYAVINSYSFT